MSIWKETALARKGAARDPFGLFRHMASEFDRMFDEPAWSTFKWPLLRYKAAKEPTTWFPEVDVYEKDNRLVTKIDLPGMKKEDVKVEITDGYLTISGERKNEFEEKKENFYRCEREYGNFYRAVPLPEGVKFEDIVASFANGVLEVSVPLPVAIAAQPRKVEIVEPVKAAKPAA